MRKLKFLLILFLIFIGINNVYAFDTSLKVYDYAQILTVEEEEQLKRDVELFIANHNMDMALVTVKYHEKTNTMNYADDFYDYNGFGIGNNNDGIIFVIDFTFRERGEIWMSTTGNAINLYTDDRINSILDNVVSKKNRGYYEMFNTFISNSNYYAKIGVLSNDTDIPFDLKNIIIISLIIPSIIILILILKNKMIKAATTANHYLIKESIIINKRSDKFITTNTTSVRINDSSSGGSSTHSGSSGISHGGGGRGL